MNFFRTKPTGVIAAEDALPGRDNPIQITGKHFVNGTSMIPPFPDHMETIIIGMGCFWGAERFFWELDGVYTTAAGYSGGTTPNPTYGETCTSRTGHNDMGSQYRTAIYGTTEAQIEAAKASLASYQEKLSATGFGEITTEIAPASDFYYAEEEHQQYLAKNPNGYCNHGFCQVAYS